MASTTAATVFTDTLLPDSKHLPRSPDANKHERSVSQFFELVSELPPEGATVVQLECWGRNEGLTNLHHFLCATIQLPGDIKLKAIIERKPSKNANSKELAKSKSSGARDLFTMFGDRHPDLPREDKKQRILYSRNWDAPDRPPTLRLIAAVAKTVSEEAAKYNLYETQCIWYAFTVFRMVPPVKQKGDYKMKLTLLESFVTKVMKNPNIPQLSAMLETLEKDVQLSIAQPAIYQVGLVEPTNPLPSTSEVAEGVHSSTDLFPMAVDSSSVATNSSPVADVHTIFSIDSSESTTTITTEPDTQREHPRNPSIISKAKRFISHRSTNNGAMQST